LHARTEALKALCDNALTSNKLKNDYIDQTSYGPVNKLAGIIESPEFEQLKNPFESFKNNTEGFRYDKFKIYVSKFLALIDNNNDASAIGTLEFLDRIAKFNTTETVCKINGELPKDIDEYQDIV
jgi:F0F1-type ATP synthase gamma subunit